MIIQLDIVEITYIVAIVAAGGAGAFLLARYRTKIARWGGLCMLSLALEMTCYLLQVTFAQRAGAYLLFLVQVVGYVLFCVFWLLFVLVFSRHRHWIRPRTVVFMVAALETSRPLRSPTILSTSIPSAKCRLS